MRPPGWVPTRSSARDSRCAPARCPRWLRRLGTIYFSVYLVQALVLLAVPALPSPRSPPSSGRRSSSARQRGVTYRLVEQPAVRLGRHSAARRPRHGPRHRRSGRSPGRGRPASRIRGRRRSSGRLACSCRGSGRPPRLGSRATRASRGRLRETWRRLARSSAPSGSSGAACFLLDVGLFQLLYAVGRPRRGARPSCSRPLVSMTVAYARAPLLVVLRTATGRGSAGSTLLFTLINGGTLVLGLGRSSVRALPAGPGERARAAGRRTSPRSWSARSCAT